MMAKEGEDAIGMEDQDDGDRLIQRHELEALIRARGTETQAQFMESAPMLAKALAELEVILG